MKSIVKFQLLLVMMLASIGLANAAATANVPKWNAYSGVKISITTTQKTLPDIYAHGFSYSLVSPRDPATGQATGKRQHSPIKFTKLINNVSPLLFQALVNNENLTSVVIQFIGIDRSTGATITLSNAHISRFEPHTQAIISDKPFADGVAPLFNQLEDIEIVFQSIKITSPNGNEGEDDWGIGNE